MLRLEVDTTDVICRKCGRKQDPWPLNRPNLCSPSDWAVCIRAFDTTTEEKK